MFKLKGKIDKINFEKLKKIKITLKISRAKKHTIFRYDIK